MRTRLRLIALSILIVGLISAAAIYYAAEPDTISDQGYEVIDGRLYQANPDKAAIHSLQVYGGDMAVTAVKINYWWVKLWHGEELGFTIGYITLFASGLILLVSSRAHSHKN